MVEGNSDRRSGTRVAARVPVSVKVPQGNLQVSGQTRDLSETGIFFYTDAQIAKGSEIEMVLVLPAELAKGTKRMVCCQASVVRLEHKENSREMGVAAVIKKLEVLPEGIV